MIDRRSSSTDRQQHPSLAGTDYVLEGVSVRDRFLTAFIFRHNKPAADAWTQSFPRVTESTAPSFSSTQFRCIEDESFSIRIENPCEPLTARVIDEWFGADDDDHDDA